MYTGQVMIVGGGAAGLAAAIAAAREQVPVTLFEKGPKPGRKIMISGAGRCNLTNSAPLQAFIEQYFGNGQFLYPAFTAFFRDDLLSLLEETGLRTKAEHNGKIFPKTDRALDVVDSLTSLARQAGTVFHFSEPVKDITFSGNRAGDGQGNGPDETPVRLKTSYQHPGFQILTSQGCYQSTCIVITTGGYSWPQTGSCGDGYKLAGALGHSLTPARPALTGLKLRDTSFRSLQGISHPLVRLRLIHGSQKIGSSQGELIWTHYGLSGPAVLRISRDLPYKCADQADPDHAHRNKAAQSCGASACPCHIEIDFLPSLSADALRQTLREKLIQQPRKHLSNVLSDCLPLPSLLLRQIMQHCEIETDHKAASASRTQTEAILTALKGLRLEITESRGYQDAMVTAGGVRLSEINPRTMESRLLPGLFFAGEVLDIDGDTGGYNLQAAFSTGWLAGQQAARSVLE